MSVAGGLLLLGLVALVQAKPYLDVHLRAQAPFDRSNISYSVELLREGPGRSLQSVRLQEPSLLRRTHQDSFEEQTVVALSHSVRSNPERTFLGVQLYDLPTGTQDFYLVDVTKTIRIGERSKVLFSSEDLSISIVVHRRHEAALVHHGVASGSVGCQCATKTCGCCQHLLVKKIHLDGNACLNVSYIPEDAGVRLSFAVNEHVYLSKEISIRNPPPLCFEVPELREYASICIRLYDIRTSSSEISACTEVDALLYHVKVARAKLGCFSMPI